MRTTASTQALVGLLSISMVSASSVLAEETIRCTSHKYRYKYCQAETDNRVSLEHQMSSSECRQGSTWGFDRHGVWVDQGCDATFQVGKRHKDKDHDSSAGTAVAIGAAVVGIAALAALSSSQGSTQQDVSSWAVGTFRGYDQHEGAEVELTILPGGSVSGKAGRNQFSGHLDGDKLQAGRHRFTIERSGNGFVATDQSNSGHRVTFRNVGSGYAGSGY